MELKLVQAKIFSLDVFDTCISRRFAYPRDLFFALGLRLASDQLTAEQAQVFARKFQAARIRAEKWASRRNWPHRCPDIYEIYHEFRAPSGCSMSAEEILKAEVALEEESIYVIPKALEEIRQARAAGCKIIFVSDMYLPEAILAPMLRAVGVMTAEDVLYVSCDVKLSKRSGKLFHHVMKKEGVVPEQVTHIGDNYHADVEMGRRAGITTRHFPHALLSPYERRIAGGNVSQSADASHAAAASRASRLALAENPELSHEFDPLFHSTIAPFLVAYVGWVIEHARRSGVKRLYFVARDGQVFYRIARELLGADADIDARYLYGSRRAWFSASITRGSSTWRRFLAMKGQSNSCLDILSRAGIPADMQASILDHMDIHGDARSENLHPDSAEKFVDAVFADRTISDQIFESATKARELVLKYFSQEGMFDGTSWALVDVGWALNSQAAMKRILSAADGKEASISGYYIGISKDHLPQDEVGAAWSFLPGSGSLLTRRRVVVEHCFTPATHSTTRGYAVEAGMVVPVFGSELRSATELKYAERLQEVATHRARLIQRFQASDESLLLSRDEAIRIAEDFVSDPTVLDAQRMSAFGTIADMRHEGSNVRPLCGPMTVQGVWSIFATTLFPKLTFSTPVFMWLEGSRALSPFYIRAPITAMLWLDKVKNRLKSGA